jgi:spermidine/putrescine transport system substrate-binding protein
MVEAPTLNLFSWPDYENPETLAGFTQQTGVAIYTSIFESNEELVHNLSNNPGAYDLVVPSDYTVRQLIQEQALLRLDKTLLPNFNNLFERFRAGRPYDPASNYSLTKTWGTTGLIWKPTTVTEPLTRWADFWAVAPQYAGRIVMIDARHEVIGIALKMLGYSLNDGNPTHLAEAEAKLLELRPHVVVSSEYIDRFVDNTVVMGIGWNGDVIQINASAPQPVNYLLPEEGSVLWTDNWCIPATALHPNNAHAFLNYLLDPAVAAAESAYIGYATVVEKALPLLDPALQSDPVIYPSESSLSNLETQAIPEESLAQRDAIWAKFLEG